MAKDSSISKSRKVVLRLEDLAGIDAGKISVEEAFKILDKMRSEDRY